MFRFAHPLALALLLPLAAAAWRVYRRRTRPGILFSATHRIPGFQRTWRHVMALVAPAVFLAGLGLAIIALARPQTVLSRTRRSSDVIAMAMVVDVSGSMQALDLSDFVAGKLVKERTRLDAVKEAFAAFIQRRPDDLLALLTFGGYVSTRAPLTTDHNAVLHVLQGVEIPREVMDRNGAVLNQEELLTAIGDALATACGRLEDAEVQSRIIVLLSDGESNTGLIEPEEAIQLARSMGIRVYTIGIGSSRAEVPVWGMDFFGKRRLQAARLPLDEELLRTIASDTGGRYYNVRDPDGLDSAMDEIDQLETTRVEHDVFSQYNELFPWILLPALGLILAGTALNMGISRQVI